MQRSGPLLSVTSLYKIDNEHMKTFSWLLMGEKKPWEHSTNVVVD